MKNRNYLLIFAIVLFLVASQVALTRYFCKSPYQEKNVSAHAEEDHGEESPSEVHLTPEEVKEFGIREERADACFLNIYVEVPGEVTYNADGLAHIVPRYPGVAVEVRKNIGDRVKRGEVMAVIESNESLVPYPLKSLISGVVVEKHITLGEVIGEDVVAYVVADLSTVWVNLTLYQRDLYRVHVGQKAFISAGEHIQAEGTISYVSPVVNEETRTAIARVVLPNPQGIWKPGMFVIGKILVQREKAEICVSRKAVLLMEDGPAVFVKTGENNAYRLKRVTTGRSDSARVEIVKGLKKGEIYVAEGAFFLKSELLKASFSGGHAH